MLAGIHSLISKQHLLVNMLQSSSHGWLTLSLIVTYLGFLLGEWLLPVRPLMGSWRLETSDYEWGFSVRMDDQIKCSYPWITKLCWRIYLIIYILASYYITTLIRRDNMKQSLFIVNQCLWECNSFLWIDYISEDRVVYWWFTNVL